MILASPAPAPTRVGGNVGASPVPCRGILRVLLGIGGGLLFLQTEILFGSITPSILNLFYYFFGNYND